MVKMANEFWNVIVGCITSFIIGMVIHSAMGHTYSNLLWKIFHSDEIPPCHTKEFYEHNPDCQTCKYREKCERI